MQAVEITAVVKFAVIGQGVFDNEIASCVTGQQLAVLADEGSVIFTHMTVFIMLIPLQCETTEDNA